MIEDQYQEEPRYALVTGASGAIGSEIYRYLDLEKYLVFLHYNSNVINALVTWGEAMYVEGTSNEYRHPLKYDLTDSNSRKKLVERIERVTDRLDVLINCAGSYSLKSIEEISIEDWEKSLALNCTAAFHLTQLLSPLLQKAGTQGRVINIGDAAADRLVSRPIGTPYYIAKVGLNIVTRTFAEVLSPSGVTVNMVSPGFMENSVGVPPKKLPMGKKGKISDIVAAVDYLLSPEASYVSGANLTVSGGWRV